MLATNVYRLAGRADRTSSCIEAAQILRSACLWRVGFGVVAETGFALVRIGTCDSSTKRKFAIAGRARQHAGGVRSLGAQLLGYGRFDGGFVRQARRRRGLVLRRSLDGENRKSVGALLCV